MVCIKKLRSLMRMVKMGVTNNSSMTIINLCKCNNNKCRINKCNQMATKIMNLHHLLFQKLNNKLIKQKQWHMHNKYNNNSFKQYRMMECWWINSIILLINNNMILKDNPSKRQIKNTKKLKSIKHQHQRGRKVLQKVRPPERL